jgi:hypothetical protein
MATGYPKTKSRTARGVCPRCRRAIEWITLPSGSRAPIDTVTDDERGEVYVLGEGASWRLGLPIRDPDLRAEAIERGFALFRFHSDTCKSSHYRERADLA